MKRITADLLKSLQVCMPHLMLFMETFPQGAELKDFDRAVAEGLDVVWLAQQLDPATMDAMELVAERVLLRATAPLREARYLRDVEIHARKYSSWLDKREALCQSGMEYYRAAEPYCAAHQKALLDAAHVALARYLTS